MTAFFSWYILITLLGWITFPLAHRLFPALADRGYTLSRAFGLLAWGYIFWLFGMLGVAQNDIGGLLLGLAVLGGLSAWAYFSQNVEGNTQFMGWIRENRKLILTTELLFLLSFGFMTFVRANNPEILGTEKPMELMFINGILNSPTFPPRDLWLSGYSISYYYFGYVMTSMLAMFTGFPATMAFNLMIALIFALGAIGAYGILYNLLATGQTSNNPLSSFILPILAPLFLLILSNVEGFLEVLHHLGLFWTGTQNFWTWLDIPELRDAPAQTLGWVPDRFWWWWRASRVIMDYDLQNNWTGDVISEFPAFSFILSDLHPHVLGIPFMLLAIAVALNLFLGGWRGRMDLFFGQLRISKTGFFVSALVLGGLAFLNTWDILTGAALIVFSYALFRVAESGWGWERIEDILLLGIPLGLTAFVMYLPFYVGFDSQAGGIVPSFMYPTRGAQLWVMWGTLFVPLFAFLIHLWRARTPANWRAGILTVLGTLLALFVAMFAVGFLALRLKPELVLPILEAQQRSVAAFIADSMARRLAHIGSLLTLTALLVPAFAFLFRFDRLSENDSTEIESSALRFPTTAFVLLLVVLGTLLILGPDFLYLRDNFGYRINTIFKFYYQAWILVSLASAYGTVVLLKNLRGAANGIFSVLFAFVLVVGLTYPVLGFLNKTNNFKPPSGFTLDDFDRVRRENPDEAAAILWLRAAPDGVIAEAVGGQYSQYARISIYTGLPTVLGWPGHEGQWRDYALQGSREQDIETLYSTPDWGTAQEIIKRYDTRYILVGNLERVTYHVNEEKFNRFLKPVFQQGNVVIYEAP
jgi:YYY domain-containing protein